MPYVIQILSVLGLIDIIWDVLVMKIQNLSKKNPISVNELAIEASKRNSEVFGTICIR